MPNLCRRVCVLVSLSAVIGILAACGQHERASESLGDVALSPEA